MRRNEQYNNGFKNDNANEQTKKTCGRVGPDGYLQRQPIDKWIYIFNINERN